MKTIILLIMLISLSFLFKKKTNLEYERIIQNFRIAEIKDEKIKLVSGNLFFYIKKRSDIDKKIVGNKLRVKATLDKNKKTFKTISIQENGKTLSFSLVSNKIFSSQN